MTTHGLSRLVSGGEGGREGEKEGVFIYGAAEAKREERNRYKRVCGKTRGVAVAVSYRYLAPSPLLTLAASRMRRRTGDKKYITPRHGCKLRASGKEGREIPAPFSHLPQLEEI